MDCDEEEKGKVALYTKDCSRSSLMSTQRKKSTLLGEEPYNQIQVIGSVGNVSKAESA